MRWNNFFDMNNPKVSIVTVCYNSIKTIERTILSVVNQTYSNIEYIIIDGGSTDGTLDIINKYRDKIAFVQSETDKGIYDAMNKGIKVSTGEIVGIINSDDQFYDSNTINEVVEQYCSNEGCVIHGDIEYSDGNISRKVAPDSDIDKMKRGPVVLHPTMFVPKDIYNAVGLFSTQYRIAADYDMMLKIYLRGYRYVYLNRVISVMTAGGASDKNRIRGFYECYLITLRAGLNPLLCTFNFLKRAILSSLLS